MRKMEDPDFREAVRHVPCKSRFSAYITALDGLRHKVIVKASKASQESTEAPGADSRRKELFEAAGGNSKQV